MSSAQLAGWTFSSSNALLKSSATSHSLLAELWLFSGALKPSSKSLRRESNLEDIWALWGMSRERWDQVLADTLSFDQNKTAPPTTSASARRASAAHGEQQAFLASYREFGLM
jgi:hypothetical protein